MLDSDERIQVGLLRIVRWVTIRVRRTYYVDRPSWSRGLDLLPGRVREMLGVADRAARDGRRIELGAGSYPQPGFVHFDSDWTANHLEGIACAWELPVPDDWAQQIVAVHMLEHIHPTRVTQTLAEWYRALAPGGLVQVHVPNSKRLMERFVEVSPPEKWKFMAALLGMYGNPDVAQPEQMRRPADHQLVFDPPLLIWLFQQTGFSDVRDVSDSVRDRHSEGWADVIDQISIVLTARKPC